MVSKGKKEEVIDDSENDDDFDDEDDEVIMSLVSLKWKKRLRKKSKSYQLSKKKFKPLQSMATLSRKDSLIKNFRLNKKIANASSENNTSLSYKKLTTSSWENTHSLILTSKKLENSSLNKSKKPNTITSLNKKFLSSGSKHL